MGRCPWAESRRGGGGVQALDTHENYPLSITVQKFRCAIAPHETLLPRFDGSVRHPQGSSYALRQPQTNTKCPLAAGV